MMKDLKRLTLTAKRTKRLLERFCQNHQGAAAIEFAFIAPLMIATYFGTVEVSRAYIIKNKVETVSETVADLVAQGKTITTSQLDDIFAISAKVLKTSEQANFNIVVTAVRTEPDSSGNMETKVMWSESKNGSNEHTVDSDYTDLPDGIAKNYESIIVTELYYEHTSLFEYFIKGQKSFDRRFINKPRYSSDIPCTDC